MERGFVGEGVFVRGVEGEAFGEEGFELGGFDFLHWGVALEAGGFGEDDGVNVVVFGFFTQLGGLFAAAGLELADAV